MVFAIHWQESAMDLHVFPIPIPPFPSLLYCATCNFQHKVEGQWWGSCLPCSPSQGRMVFLSTLSLCHSTPRFFSIFVSFILFFHLVSGLCNGKESRIWETFISILCWILARLLQFICICIFSLLIGTMLPTQLGCCNDNVFEMKMWGENSLFT